MKLRLLAACVLAASATTIALPAAAQGYYPPPPGYPPMDPDDGVYAPPPRYRPVFPDPGYAPPTYGQPRYAPPPPVYAEQPYSRRRSHQIANYCVTPAGQCQLPGPVFVGKGCSCYFADYGKVRGQTIP